MRQTVLIPLVLVAQSAAAQTCDGPIGPIETCMVGAWIGSSTIPEAFQAFLDSMPSTIAANVSDFGQPVGMIIYEDGFYATLPTGAVAWALQDIGDGQTAEVDMNFQTTTATGWFSGVSGELAACQLSGGGIGQMTVTTPDGSATGPLAPPPGAAMDLPPMAFSCADDAMSIIVQVPPPVGAITYNLQRIDPDDYSDEFARRVEERFAPAE